MVLEEADQCEAAFVIDKLVDHSLDSLISRLAFKMMLKHENGLKLFHKGLAWSHQTIRLGSHRGSGPAQLKAETIDVISPSR